MGVAEMPEADADDNSGDDQDEGKRHTHTELAASEQLLRNSPEATPITAASPANKARDLVDKT